MHWVHFILHAQELESYGIYYKDNNNINKKIIKIIRIIIKIILILRLIIIITITTLKVVKIKNGNKCRNLCLSVEYTTSKYEVYNICHCVYIITEVLNNKKL